MFKTVVNKSKSCVSFEFYFHCSTQEQLLFCKYSLGSYHTSSYTALNNNNLTLTASQEAHTLNMQGAAGSSCNNNSFNNKIKYKAGNHLVHVSVYFPNITLRPKIAHFARATLLHYIGNFQPQKLPPPLTKSWIRTWYSKIRSRSRTSHPRGQHQKGGVYLLVVLERPLGAIASGGLPAAGLVNSAVGTSCLVGRFSKLKLNI